MNTRTWQEVKMLTSPGDKKRRQTHTVVGREEGGGGRNAFYATPDRSYEGEGDGEIWLHYWMGTINTTAVSRSIVYTSIGRYNVLYQHICR